MKYFTLIGIIIASLLGGGCQTVEVSDQEPQTNPAKVISSDASSSLLVKNWDETPIPFYISQTVPERFVQPILKSFATWEEEAGKKLFNYKGRSNSMHQDFDGENVVYWDTEKNENGFLGVTHTSQMNKTHLIEADIVFHGDPNSYGELSCENHATLCHDQKGQYDITTTALHEIGHLLGFAHTNADGNIMNPNFGMNSVVHNFSDDLIADLKSAYSPDFVASR